MGQCVRFVVVAALLLGQAVLRAQDLAPFQDRELEAMPGARAEYPESRIGQAFWVQPKARPFSVDFFASPELDQRVPVEGTRRFLVMGLVPSEPLDGEAPLYAVRFGPGEDAFIPLASFEAQLYVDLPPQSETRLKSDLYLSPEAYFFSIKSIFTEDPALVWERIRNLGPTRVRPLAAPPRPGSKREERKP